MHAITRLEASIAVESAVVGRIEESERVITAAAADAADDDDDDAAAAAARVRDAKPVHIDACGGDDKTV